MQVEFNKAALSLSDSIPAEQKKAALNRLLKVGALINALSSHYLCIINFIRIFSGVGSIIPGHMFVVDSFMSNTDLNSPLSCR